MSGKQPEPKKVQQVTCPKCGGLGHDLSQTPESGDNNPPVCWRCGGDGVVGPK